jgi:lysyl-tRNA synthetase class 2
MSNTTDDPPEGGDENKLIAERRAKLAQLRQDVMGAPAAPAGGAFPNDFRRDSLAGQLHDAFGDRSAEWLEANPARVQVGGRMLFKRVMGKASFAKIADRTGQIQLFLQQDALGAAYEAFKSWDVGDIIGAGGVLFRTRTNELSVRVDSLRLLVKSLRPLPDKWHGLADTETRYRRRYVDLIVNEASRNVFLTRTRIVRFLRNYLDALDFIEVETPMMQPIPGGAAAQPFITHHNALDVDMYLRIAPELYLKRLIVGGFERVYEINRNFRNEGLSTRHNPEFTMLELYLAYGDYRDLMDWVEKALRDLTYLRKVCEKLGIAVSRHAGPGKLQMEIFDKTVEHTLLDPTFVHAYPAEVSPLSRANDADPFLTDRFEFFMSGRELANGFSELNDPEDQAARFRAQVALKDSGDQEAMFYDADYIRALEYGMPPTAGLGVGIDRLVMFFTDSPSIRDVILFPHMRPETD